MIQIGKLGTKIIDRLTNYLFPENHYNDVHSSVINSQVLLLIRILSLTYLFGIYIWGISTDKSPLNNIIYLTMIGYFFTWLYFLLTIQDFCMKWFGKLSGGLPGTNNLKYYIQIIYEIAFCFQLPITAIFWGFLFQSLTKGIALNANLHSGPLIVLLIDFIFNSFSFPLQHFWIIILISIVYAVINLVYTLTVHNIYPPITWDTPKSYALFTSSIVMALLMFFLGRIVYLKLKKPKIDAMIEKMRKSDSNKMNNKFESVLSKQILENNKNIGEKNKSDLQQSLVDNLS